MAPVLHSTNSFLRNSACIASLLLITMLGIGCVGDIQKKTIPGLSLSASSFNFQTVIVGQKATQTFQISNTGTASLQISAPSVSNPEFSITGPSAPLTVNGSSVLLTLLPAHSFSYTLTFAPTTPGSATATVNLATSAASQPVSISLSGNGEKGYANLLVTPTVVSFGNLALKSTSTQNVTLENTGDISVALQGVTVSGAGFGYADLSPGYSLAPNQKVTFQVWFSPKVAGPASATLSLLSPNISSPETLSMSGNGVSTTTPPPAAPPTPPPAIQHTVALTWNASSSQVIGYRVYRSETSGNSYNSLNGTAVNALAYSDSTVASGTTYYYVVTAVDSAGVESVYSNQVVAVVPSS
ncbi:MAG: choice-of-anchor D domain-containing protein [Candidatus Acidiferrum sp.]